MSEQPVRSLLLAIMVGASFGAIACGASSQRAAEPPIAATWRAQCGVCHTRIEPREKTRSQMDRATARHRKRVKLTDAEWTAMNEFLAPSP